MSQSLLWIAGLLALAVLVTLLQLVLRPRFSAAQGVVRLVLTGLSAGLLWLALFPPARPLNGAALVVLTAGADPAAALARRRAGDVVLALPEAPQIDGITRVADLAAALRQVPQAQSLTLPGHGLTPRDQAVTVAMPVQVQLPEPPSGLVHWQGASIRPAGSLWEITGQVSGQPGARVAVLDPAGAIVATAATTADGTFALQTRALTPGRMLYQLQLLGADEAVVEAVALPLTVTPAYPAKVLLLGGAPSPELKYLRRWAVDAGLKLYSRLALGQGMQVGNASVQALPGGWRDWDLVVLDERSLAGLGEAGRSELDAAVRAGAGLLLRVTGPLGSAERDWLKRLDIALQPVDRATQMAWPARSTDPAAAAQAPLLLSRRPLAATGASNLPLLQSPAGDTLGVWRPLGSGRVGVLWLADSFRLQLAGQGDQHSMLWQQVFATLARAAPTPAQPPVRLQTPQPLRVDQRVVWCGLDPARRYTLHGAQTTQAVFPDPAAPGCAAAWPEPPGWLELRDGDAVLQTVYVHPADAAPAHAARQQAEATLALAQRSPSQPTAITATRPGPAWPWWLAWLAATCGLWWFERRGWQPR